LAFFAQTTASFFKNMIITLVYDKNADFFAENWQKSQKIVIVTLTPATNGDAVMREGSITCMHQEPALRSRVTIYNATNSIARF
jgi:hypothetical protein